MAPGTRNRTVLLCPLCEKRGFIRSKPSEFRVPQRNKKLTFYQVLDYVAKLSFARFIYDLEHESEKRTWSFDDYEKIVPFSVHSKKELFEFESKVRKRLSEATTHYNKQFLTAKKENKDDKLKSTNELSLLYFSLSLISLKKFMQKFNSRIEKDFEEDLINHLRNSFFVLTFTSDERNKISLEAMLNIMKDREKLGLNYAIIKNLKEFCPIVCRQCKKRYPETVKIRKCPTCGQPVDKVKPSMKYLKKRLEEIETRSTEFSTDFYYFLALMFVVRDDLLKEKSMKQIFKNFFDMTLSEYLTNLKPVGTTYYAMVHSIKGKKTQCYLKDEADILKIHIINKEYIESFKEVVRILVYGHSGNPTKNGVVVYNILNSVNFPFEYRHNKAMEDYKNFSLEDYKDEGSKKILELGPLAEKFLIQSKEKKNAHDALINFYEGIRRLQEKWKEQKRIPNYHMDRDHNTHPDGKPSTPHNLVEDPLKTIIDRLEQFRSLLNN